MTIKRAVYILFIFFIMFLMGCATGISRQSRSKVTYAGTFSELQKTPDVYKDEIIMLGGKVFRNQRLIHLIPTHGLATCAWQ